MARTRVSQSGKKKVYAARCPRHPSREILGELVRARRQGLGLTQAALAKAAGVQRSLIYMLEKGTRPVSVDALFFVLSALDVAATAVLDSALSLSRVPSATRRVPNSRR